MKATIQKALKEIEQANDVTILYACESGSRAWGFPSRDSDYDIRFIYAHPKEWYLSVNDRELFMNFPVEGKLDFHGWDIKKTIQLARNSNPSLLEWITSPIRYRPVTTVSMVLRRLILESFQELKGIHHYNSIAKNTYNKYLAVRDLVNQKKYLYALRPLLARNHLLEGRGVPPVKFSELLKTCKNDAVVNEIKILMRNKQKTREKDLVPRNEILHSFIVKEINQTLPKKPLVDTPLTDKQYDLFFRWVIS